MRLRKTSNDKIPEYHTGLERIDHKLLKYENEKYVELGITADSIESSAQSSFPYRYSFPTALTRTRIYAERTPRKHLLYLNFKLSENVPTFHPKRDHNK